MYFYNLIKEMSKDKKIRLYVDMDGVLAKWENVSFQDISPRAFSFKKT